VTLERVERIFVTPCGLKLLPMLPGTMLPCYAFIVSFLTTEGDGSSPTCDQGVVRVQRQFLPVLQNRERISIFELLRTLFH
jgi:hypothetical protein